MPVHARSLLARRQLCRREAGGPGGPQVELEPAIVCALATKKASRTSDHYQQLEGGDLMHTGEAIPGVLGPFLVIPVQERHRHVSPERL